MSSNTPTYKNGELDPSSSLGFATITEHVVIDVLGDATKEIFGSHYDLISKSIGKVNVKYSMLHDFNTSREFWHFIKKENAVIPDYYVCLGMDKFRTEILKVWVIPGNSDVVIKRGIIIRKGLETRFDKYLQNPYMYNKVFQEMDIKSKSEFSNSTKPKVSESCYKYQKLQYEIQEIKECIKKEDSKMILNERKQQCIKFSTFNQKLTLLGIVKIAQKKKLPIKQSYIIRFCLTMSEKYHLPYVSIRSTEEAICEWNTCGLIVSRYPNIRQIKAPLVDIENVIYQDTEFSKIKEGESS